MKEQADIKKGKTIACPEKFSAPCVYKTFTAKEGEQAEIEIFGLGFFELFVNGKRVGEEFLKPVVTDYNDRDFSSFLYPLSDQTSHSVAYTKYDLSSYLIDGENLLTVLLGNGYYRQKQRLAEGDVSFGNRLVCSFSLAVGNRLYHSSGDERCAESFIVRNNLFFGETHDYEHGELADFVGKAPKNTEPVECINPFGNLFQSDCPPDRIVRRLMPKRIETDRNKNIFDAGENLSGFVVLKPKSSEVIVRYAETLKGGKLDFFSAGGEEQIYENRFLNGENAGAVHAWFSWGGFRYFEITGDAEVLYVADMHSDIEQRFYFSCGNETLNWLFNAYVRTQLMNMHCGFPTDCPHRERLGYTGDGQLTAETAMLFFHAERFYEKWIKDIAECQDLKTGHIQHTAPFMGGGGGPGGWGCAIVNVPYAYYKVYGDRDILEKYFVNMTAYLECMRGFVEDGLIVKERKKGWCLGEWATLDPVLIPEPFVNTYFYIKSMKQVEKIACILSKKVDYSFEIARSKDALIKTYYDDRAGDFCGNIQGANAFAVDLGLGDERTAEHLVAKYEELGKFDTGIFATDLISDYLVKSGRLDLLVKILSGRSFPSYGYMAESGATTIWEYWQGWGSGSHPMFGALLKQFLYGILGISVNEGLNNLVVMPKYVDGIGYVKAKLAVPGGEVSFDYRYSDGKLDAKVESVGSVNVTMQR